MVLPRPTVLRAFAPSRLVRSAPRTANRAIARRGYASGHGDAHAAPSSDVPWAIGAVAVTLPACWYLWPSGAHAEAHGQAHADKHQSPETKAERSEKSTHEADAAPEISEEKATPESKGDTDDVQFKGKTADGDENNKQEDTRKVEDDSKGAKKLRIDSASAKELGAGPKKRDDGSESAATAKPVSVGKGGEGDITSKQEGVSTTATKHSTDITQDPEKSKKGEGSPETAKSQGTVSVNRPHTEQRKGDEGENQEHNPDPEAAKANEGDKTEDKTEDKDEKKDE